MDKSQRIKVGISIGDSNGIGPELILKTFEDTRVFDFCTPVVFTSPKVLNIYKKKLKLQLHLHSVNTLEAIKNKKLNVFNVGENKEIYIQMGKPTEISGKHAFESLEASVIALRDKKIDVLLTSPINKNNIQSNNFRFSGHTDYLESIFSKDCLMILCNSSLRVGLITGHIPISKVSQRINSKLIEKKVGIMLMSLREDFGILKPKIAVLGLNPHCGDRGVIGTEDDQIIAPTVKKLFDRGIMIFGPYAADGFFGSENYMNFDGVLAMYHDQGLAPFKALSFGKGVNYTAGLDVIRTSPDHGTAYDISGKNKADIRSFREALFLAIDLYRKRNEYRELSKNALKVKV